MIKTGGVIAAIEEEMSGVTTVNRGGNEATGVSVVNRRGNETMDNRRGNEATGVSIVNRRGMSGITVVNIGCD